MRAVPDCTRFLQRRPRTREVPLGRAAEGQERGVGVTAKPDGQSRPRRPGTVRAPATPSCRGCSHLPGTFAPLRFQNCFLPPSLAMAASPHPPRGPGPLSQASLPAIPFHRSTTERGHLGTGKQPRALFAS